LYIHYMSQIQVGDPIYLYYRIGDKETQKIITQILITPSVIII